MGGPIRRGFDPWAVTNSFVMPEAGLKKSVADIIKANIKQIMMDAIADPPGHAYAVAGGRDHFRRLFVKDMRSFFKKDTLACGDLGDIVWNFLHKKWGDMYPHTSPQAYLDAYSPVSPPTEQEIEDAWELEIASDERSMQEHYEGSARIRKGADLGARRGRG